MRIIAGVARGRVLASVAGPTRPTSDRAREGVFSSLLSEFGDFYDLNFLDLFAGSGAMGLEALSRGATIVHAVEKDELACKTIATNAELVLKNKTAGIFHLYSMPVHKFLEATPPTTYDIVYADPPYLVSDAELHKDLVNLRVDGFLNEGSLVAVERADKSGTLEWPKGYQPLRSRKYGRALIYYAKLA